MNLLFFIIYYAIFLLDLLNLLSTLKKSMGDEVKPTKTTEDKLELTNDLFNLIDSMYDERNENK